MRISTNILALVCASAFGASAYAQDSVSKVLNLPGDAVLPRDATEQINDFVVDQTVLRTSWNTPFGIAPLIKFSATRATPAPEFYTALAGAQSMSRTIKSGVPFLRTSYSAWTGPGFGVNNNAALNDPGAPVSTTGFTGQQFAVAAAEFATGGTDPIGANASLGNIVGGVVNYQTLKPSRLYVSRVVAAVNGSTDSCNLAQFGMGAVDSDGNVHFRADNFGTADCSGNLALTAQNLFRVRMAARSGATLNIISNLGGSDATNWLLQNSATTHGTPNIVPQQIAGRPILAGGNFSSQYVYEQVAGSVTGTTTHFAPGVTDQRGTVAYSPHNFALFGASVNGTAATLSKIGSSPATTLDLWGLASDGTPTSPIARTLPATISDPIQTWSNTLAPGGQEFDHYHDQTAFRGGNSQVAIGKDNAGNLLAAGCVYYGTPAAVPNTNPNTYIAVSRTNAAGTTTWSVAAWTLKTTSTSDGKTIFMNGTTAIGRLSSDAFGPALSAPMIDSLGNVWFLAGIQLNGTPVVQTVGLVRAVYDAATFSYKLELVLKQGDTFLGVNSNTRYAIDYIELTDGNSISSGTAYSGNICASAFNNQSTTGLSTSDSATLGGLVISARIVYDTNNDGMYVRQTPTMASPDEDYQVLLYVSGTTDCDGNGIPDDRDITAMPSLDQNGNGVIDTCEGSVGMGFCFGDGTGTACPCGNSSPAGAGQGCLSSLGIGAQLTGGGIASISNDTAVLTGVNMPNSSVLYFQGTSQLGGGNGVMFGDGKRCAGGSIIRLKTKTNMGGMSQYPTGAEPSISVRGLITAPGIRTYQAWYRNAAAFCTAGTFNLSNGLQITWTL